MIIDLHFNKSNLNWSIQENALKSTCINFILNLTEITKHSSQTDNFPNELNSPQVTSAYIKKIVYHNVLSYVSKIFDKIFYEQIKSYIKPRFSHILWIPNTP